MTKNKILILSLCAITFFLLLFIKQESFKNSSDAVPSKTKLAKPVAGLEVMPGPAILGDEVLTAPPKPLDPFDKEVKDVVLENDSYPRENWERELETTLITQGGGTVKSVKIVKVEKKSFKENKHTITAESVVVSIKNDKGEETSFRALIDPSTGRVLQTWDQPVRDPINPREEFGVGLDPRYLQKSP